MMLSVDDLRSKYGYQIPSGKEAIYATRLATAESRVLAEIGYSEEVRTDYFEGVGRHFQLTCAPVAEIISTTPECDYRYDKRSRALVTKYLVQDLEVTYRTGFDKVPDEILSCIAYTAMHLAKLQASGLMGVTQRTTDGGAETIEQNALPTVVRGLLQRYKVGVLA